MLFKLLLELLTKHHNHSVSCSVGVKLGSEDKPRTAGEQGLGLATYTCPRGECLLARKHGDFWSFFSKLMHNDR